MLSFTGVNVKSQLNSSLKDRSRFKPHGQAMTPREIVAELDKFIIGQGDAKRKVAIALRNRWRRQQVPDELRDEISPKNIIMIGPTGVGKTEIARRLAKLARSPFVKVEASKFTEVGYVGRDVESMVRDLVDVAVAMVEREQTEEVEELARDAAVERLVSLLSIEPQRPGRSSSSGAGPFLVTAEGVAEADASDRDVIKKRLLAGDLDERIVELSISESQAPMLEIFTPQGGMEEMGLNFKDMLGNLFPKRNHKASLAVKEALPILQREEAEKLVDKEAVKREALRRVEEDGIIFLDEIDKIAGRESKHGPDISREGVQRDLLPIVAG